MKTNSIDGREGDEHNGISVVDIYGLFVIEDDFFFLMGHHELTEDRFFLPYKHTGCGCR